MTADLLKLTVEEIYMPDAIVAMARPSAFVDENNLERISDSYDYWRERALFDSVANGDNCPLREFAFYMSPIVPYSDIVDVSMQMYNDEEWESIFAGLLSKRRRVKELVSGERTDNSEDVIRCWLLGRDYLLETMAKAVERHYRQHRSSPSRIFF